MQKKHRNFGPMSTSGLSEEVRKAVNAAFDAMSTWRTETAENSEKNSAQIIEKMAEAGRVLGWPQEIVEVCRTVRVSLLRNASLQFAAA